MVAGVIGMKNSLGSVLTLTNMQEIWDQQLIIAAIVLIVELEL